VVVVSVSGWDGSRILGVFKSEKEALELCENAGFDTSHETFHLDIVEVNQISTHTELVIDGSKKAGGLVKVHVYNEVGKRANNAS